MEAEGGLGNNQGGGQGERPEEGAGERDQKNPGEGGGPKPSGHNVTSVCLIIASVIVFVWLLSLVF